MTKTTQQFTEQDLLDMVKDNGWEITHARPYMDNGERGLDFCETNPDLLVPVIVKVHTSISPMGPRITDHNYTLFDEELALWNTPEKRKEWKLRKDHGRMWEFSVSPDLPNS